MKILTKTPPDVDAKLGEMSNVEYRGLHSVVEIEVEYWLAGERVKNDIIQIQRDIKIELILNEK